MLNRRRMLRVLVLSMLMGTYCYGSQVMAAPISENTIGGEYQINDKKPIITVENDKSRTVTAISDVTVVTDKVYDKSSESAARPIFLGSDVNNTELTIDMNHHNLNMGPYGALTNFKVNKSNNKLNIIGADKFIGNYAMSNWIQTPTKSENNKINIEANEIEINKTAANDEWPIIALSGNNSARINAQKNIVVNNEGVSPANVTTQREGANIELQAGQDIVFNQNNIDNAPVNYLEKSILKIKANHNLIYNSPVPTNMINSKKESSVEIKAGNLIYFNIKEMGFYPGIYEYEKSRIIIDSSDFISNMPRTISMGSESLLRLNASQNFELISKGFRGRYETGSAISIASKSVGLINAGNDIYIETESIQPNIRVYSEGILEIKANKNINLKMKAVDNTMNQSNIIADNGKANVVSQSGNISIVNDNGANLYALNSGTITLTGSTAIITNADSLISNLEGKINLNGSTTITSGGSSAIASKSGKINFNDSLAIDSGDNAFEASSGGIITANTEGKTKAIHGDIFADGGSVLLDLNTDNSYLVGSTTATDVNVEATESGITDRVAGDATNLVISLSPGALWQVTGNSSLTSLNNNGTVNLIDDAHAGKSITTKSLSGNGIMALNLDWNTNQGIKAVTAHSDYVMATEKATGTQALVSDKSLMNLDKMSVTDRLYFATLANSDAVFTSDITQRNVAPGHLYDYIIGIDNETNENTTDWFFGSVGQEESPIVDTAKVQNRALYDMAVDIDTLNKRFGEARYAPDEIKTDKRMVEGLWARGKYSHMGHDSYSGHGYRVEVGRNYVRERNDTAIVHRGVAFAYNDSRAQFTSGNSKYRMYTGSLYHTWLGTKGHYLDLVGRIGKINTKSTTNLVNEDISKASYGVWYQQSSIEWGRKMPYTGSWYFEPQTQLQYTHINSKSYVTSDGIMNSLDSVNSLIGRIGFRLGRDIDENTSWYVKADVLHEFAGNHSFDLTSIDGLERINYDETNHDTWYDVGMGINAKFNDDSTLWLEFERKLGGSFTTNWEINGGMTWKFN